MPGPLVLHCCNVLLLKYIPRSIVKNCKPIIAIVDDEREICLMLSQLLQRRDIPVSFIAYDGQEALLKFGSADPKPDIVILDNYLLHEKGVDVMRRLHMIQPSTKVIFFSSDAGAKKEAYEAGAVLFLVKPVSLKTITDAIDIVYNNQSKYEFNGFTFAKSRA